MFSKSKSEYSSAMKGDHRTHFIYRQSKNILKNCAFVTKTVNARKDDTIRAIDARRLLTPTTNRISLAYRGGLLKANGL